MRKRVDRWVAIGTMTVVTIVPTVLVAASWGDDTGRSRDFSPATGTHGGTGTEPSGTSPSSPSPDELVGPPSSWDDETDDSADRRWWSDGKWPAEGSAPAIVESGDSRADRGRSLRPASNGARITRIAWRGHDQFDLTVRSPALAGSRKVRVLVPSTWRAGSRRTWPIVYAFHGGKDDYTSWTRSTDIESLARRYDVMVAMPEGANGSYTDWFNDGKGGNPRWETFHLQEVRQLLERNFRAGTARAAMGLSSGAGGGLTYAARYPGMFRYVAAYSGILSMLSPGIPSMLMYVNAATGVDPTSIWGDPVLNRSNWRQHDPASLVDRLRGTGIYVSSGNGKVGPLDNQNKAPWDIGLLSETQVYRSSRDFVERARDRGVPVTADFYGNGSHSWPYWRREMHRNWPAIMRSLGARRL